MSNIVTLTNKQVALVVSRGMVKKPKSGVPGITWSRRKGKWLIQATVEVDGQPVWKRVGYANTVIEGMKMQNEFTATV